MTYLIHYNTIFWNLFNYSCTQYHKCFIIGLIIDMSRTALQRALILHMEELVKTLLQGPATLPWVPEVAHGNSWGYQRCQVPWVPQVAQSNIFCCTWSPSVRILILNSTSDVRYTWYKKMHFFALVHVYFFPKLKHITTIVSMFAVLWWHTGC